VSTIDKMENNKLKKIENFKIYLKNIIINIMIKKVNVPEGFWSNL
jgi:hypothetical protein